MTPDQIIASMRARLDQEDHAGPVTVLLSSTAYKELRRIADAHPDSLAATLFKMQRTR